MRILAIIGFFLGVIVFWSYLNADSRREMDIARAEAIIGNYCFYRTAVNDYVLKNKTPGVVPLASLNIPSGWVPIRNWQNLVTPDGDGLLCYVYGAASIEDRTALLRFYNNSMTIGWNNNGSWVRNGSAMSLPISIPNGAIVSVIRISN